MHLLDQDVDMIRHGDPGNEPIAPAIEETQRVLHNRGIERIGEQALAEPPVNRGFVGPMTVPGGASRIQPLLNVAWQTVGEAKGNGLNSTAAVEVRKVSPPIPELMRRFPAHRASIGCQCRTRLPNLSQSVPERAPSGAPLRRWKGAGLEGPRSEGITPPQRASRRPSASRR